MRAGKALALPVLLASLMAPAQSAARIYDPAGQCVDRAGIAGYERVDRRAGYEVFGRGPSVRVAENAAEIIRHGGFWLELADRFGGEPRTEPGPGGSPLRYRIFLTNEPLGDADGLVARYCDTFDADAVVVATGLDRRRLEATLAHELFHAFSAGAGGGPIGEWWGEATATWGEMQLARDERRVNSLDRQFIQQPHVPLNRPVSESDVDDQPYGAWRFVEWLAPYLGGDAGLYAFMIDTFRRMGAPVGGEEAVRAVRNELDSRGFDLGEEYGRFWGERLYPSNPLTGPASEGQRIEFPTEEPAGGELTQDLEMPTEQLAAVVARLRLPRDSHVQRIVISAGRAPTGTYLWVQNGPALENWSAGDSATFCVGGASPTLGAKAWGGQLPLAFTNGNSEPPRPVITHTIQITVSAEECEGLVRDPTAAIDDSPVLDLPERCPAEPDYFPPPPVGGPGGGSHTDYFVFRERITRVFESASTWLRAAVAEIVRRDLSQRAAGRLIARWFYCAARRTRDIDHMPETDGAPDELLVRWRRQLVAKLRRVAEIYERGSLTGAIGPLGEAGQLYGQISGRCTVQNIATAEP